MTSNQYISLLIDKSDQGPINMPFVRSNIFNFVLNIDVINTPTSTRYSRKMAPTWANPGAEEGIAMITATALYQIICDLVFVFLILRTDDYRVTGDHLPTGLVI